MRCPACGHDNRAQARFCDACGKALAPSAAAPPPPASYTPRHLAERILTTRAALQGERKPVTVLFVDITGSLALAEQVDAEDWHAIMQRFFAILSDGVHRYEGTINQYTGDGIMALFGAPLAHEDHAQRACHAALALTPALRAYAQELRRERGLQFAVRMGLNSGEVVVGAIGDDLRMDYTAQGHTVGLAARMEQLCEPGRAYLSAETAALVEGFFELEDLGDFTIKGASTPVRVHALVGTGRLRTRFDLSRARGLSRFVGRADELAALEAALTAAAGGRARVVAVSADAGVGKSRLCAELIDRARARGAAVVATQGLAHGAALPYLPVRTLLRQLVGVEEHDGPDAVRQKTAGALLLAEPGFTARLPLVFDFLAVAETELATPTDAAARLAAVFDACVLLLRGRAARAPLVALIEDLHWIDAASDAFLPRLPAALADAAILFILNFRPTYPAQWLPASAQRLALQPLAADDGRALVADLLGHDASLGDLGERIRERAGGNPFFAEELVRSLAQQGALSGSRGAYRLVERVDVAAIPATVQAVLAARIDRLGEREKEVLQTAAVIGKRFDEPVLRAVTGHPSAELAAALQGLTAAELLDEEASGPVAVYAFRHPLTQEVAYATQLAARRSALHAAVAAVLTGLPDAAAERAALIAYHWERAGRIWEAAQWHRRTARALAGTDTREHIARLRRVVELLETVPERDETVTLALETYDDLFRASVLTNPSRDDVATLFARARALADRSGNRALLARLLASYNNLEMTLGQTAQAVAHLREASALASEIDDAQLRADVAIDQAQTAFWAGRLRDALPRIEEALAQVRRGVRARDTSIPVGLNGEAFLVALRAMCLSFVGRAREGAADSERAMRMADQTDTLEGRCVARQFRAFAAHIRGDDDTGRRYGEAALELALQAANPYLQRMAEASIGVADIFAERFAEGIAVLERVEAGVGAGDVVGWFVLPVLAEGYRRNGDAPRALALAERGLDAARDAGLLTAECLAQIALAAALIDVQGPAARPRIDAALARAAALIDESGAEAWRPRWHECRAELLDALGDAAGRDDELRVAERLCREMGMDELADRVARELAGGR